MGERLEEARHAVAAMAPKSPDHPAMARDNLDAELAYRPVDRRALAGSVLCESFGEANKRDAWPLSSL